MSKESDKSSPVHTPHEKDNRKHQPVKTKKHRPKFKLLIIIIVILIALVLIGFYAGLI
ncbi:MAG: hypothetical protein R6W85_07665 [Gillisia sp.]